MLLLDNSLISDIRHIRLNLLYSSSLFVLLLFMAILQGIVENTSYLRHNFFLPKLPIIYVITWLTESHLGVCASEWSLLPSTQRLSKWCTVLK